MYATIALDEVFYETCSTQKLDARCRQSLQAMLLNGLSPDDQRIVNRMLHAIRCGWIQVVA